MILEFKIKWKRTVYGTSFIKEDNKENLQIKIDNMDILKHTYGDTCTEPKWEIIEIKETKNVNKIKEEKEEH